MFGSWQLFCGCSGHGGIPSQGGTAKTCSPRASHPSAPSPNKSQPWGRLGAGFTLGDVAKLLEFVNLWEKDAKCSEKWD